VRVGRVSEDPHEDVRVGVGVGVGVVEKPRPADMTGLGVGHEEDDSDVLHAGLLIERGEVVLEVELFVALLERDLEHLETGDEGGEARQALLAAAADADEQCVAARSLEDAAARSLSALPRGPSRTLPRGPSARCRAVPRGRCRAVPQRVAARSLEDAVDAQHVRDGVVEQHQVHGGVQLVVVVQRLLQQPAHLRPAANR